MIFMEKNIFSNENGRLLFKNKEDMLRQHFERNLKKKFPEPKMSKKEFLKQMETLKESPLEQMRLGIQYQFYNIDTTTITEEINLMFHFQQFRVFGNVTQDFVDALANFIGDKKVLEICAGSGLLSKALSESKINVVSTDLNPPLKGFYNVEALDAVEAIENYHSEVDYIILSWSPLDSKLDFLALKKMRELNSKQGKKVKMIVIGELGGCTNSHSFQKAAKFVDDEDFNNVALAYESFSSIKDHVYLIE